MNALALAPILSEVELVYVTDQEPGITRKKRGKGFSYHTSEGERVSDMETLNRIRKLGLPPAYTDVWICLHPNGHLQATGIDDRRRKQYRYHDHWSQMRGERKFGELARFGEVLPKVRRTARLDADKPGAGERQTLGALVLLLDEAHLRVGNQCYVQENGTFGATTLLKRHVKFGEALELSFVAKGGRKVSHRLRAPRLQKILEKIADLPGRKLFVWQDDGGNVRPVESGQLNRYLSQIAGAGISAKTFRTWGGTVAAFAAAVESVGSDEVPTISGLCTAAAAELANTPAICRKSYIHPAVLTLATDEGARLRLKRRLAAADSGNSGLRMVERRLLGFLKGEANAARRLARGEKTVQARPSRATAKPRRATTSPGKAPITQIAP